MARCEKRDEGAMGCVKPAGHTGCCKVRPLQNDDVSHAAGGGFPPGNPPPGLKPRKAKPAGLSAELGALAAAVGEVEKQVTCLLDDFHAATGALAEQVRQAKDKAQSTLKALVHSRRELSAYKAASEGGAAESE